jgi:hypothetical protein
MGSFGTATTGVRLSARARDVSLPRGFKTGSGSHPASYAMGTEAPFPGDKSTGHEADRSPHKAQGKL